MDCGLRVLRCQCAFVRGVGDGQAMPAGEWGYMGNL